MIRLFCLSLFCDTDSQDSPLESIKTKEPSGWILGISAILGYTQTKLVGLQRYAMNDNNILYTIVDNSRFEYGAFGLIIK